MKIDINPSKKKLICDFLCVALGILCVYCIVWAFTGMWPWKDNPYNSYSRQAVSWLEGRLHLSEDVPYLELAIFEGKYFVSFPPFPSYIMLPFAIFFGINTPDGFITLAFGLIGAFYTLRLVNHFGKKGVNGIFWTLFLTVGSNILFTGINGWVWFIAQNMCFALSMMAIYYAIVGKGGLSLAFWACSVGCRPINAIYVFVLLYVLYKGEKEKDSTITVLGIIKKRIKWVIAPCIIALSYMILNYMRFGSIVEFGHNYLPEFTRTTTGQFNLEYLKTNIPLLFRLPEIGDDSKLIFPTNNGMAFYLASPLFITYTIYSIKAIIKKEDYNKVLIWLVPVLIAFHFFSLAAHKTLGGFQFGNRYTNDVLPYLFLALMFIIKKKDNTAIYNYPLFMLGFALNLVGTIATYNHWI